MKPSEWAYSIARDQLRDVETMATNLEEARALGRREGLEEAARIAELGEKDDLVKIIGKVIADDIRAAIAKEPKV